MQGWREWLDDLEHGTNAVEELSGGGPHNLMSIETGAMRRLIEGLRLCAEAVEEVEGGVGKVCADCGEVGGECADWCSVRKALEWLRGVGRD